jgi:hypothetical protein
MKQFTSGGGRMNSHFLIQRTVLFIASLLLLYLSSIAFASDGDIIYPDGDLDFFYEILLSDNSGGVINVSGSSGLGEINADRFDYNGGKPWGWNPITVSDASIATNPAGTEDMFGGIIVAYHSLTGIYAQRLDSNGNKLWNGGLGVLVLSGVSSFEAPIITPDGAGGAYIAHQRRLNHIQNNGTVTNAIGYEFISENVDRFGMVYDGQRVRDRNTGEWLPGGVFLVWHRYTYDPDTSVIHAQRIKDNNPQWGDTVTMNGVVVADADIDFDDRNSRFYQLIHDGNRGLIVAWQDHTPDRDQIRIQRLDSSGNRVWGDNGIPVVDTSVTGGTTVSYGFGQTVVTTDGAGGAILAWVDSRDATPSNLSEWDIYCQRVNATGEVLWKANGVRIQNNFTPTPPFVGTDTSPAMVSDGNGGAVIAWQHTTELSRDIYMNRIDGNGMTLWTQWAVDDDSNDQESPVLAFDGTGPDPSRAIVAWKGAADTMGERARMIEVSSSPPDNDQIVDAVILDPEGPQNSEGRIDSLTWGTHDISSSCDGNSDQPDVWYKLTAPAEGVFNVNTCGTNDLFGIDSGLDTVLSLYNVNPHGVVTELICNDNAFRDVCSDQGLTRDSFLSWPVSEGETVYVRVSRHDETTNGLFRLDWGFFVNLSGDSNDDGDVDGKDLSDLAYEFGSQCGTDCKADFNDDGLVDHTDLSLLANNYGKVPQL